MLAEPLQRTTRDGLARTLTSTRLFRTVDPAFVATLAPHTTIVRVPQGGRLWQRV